MLDVLTPHVACLLSHFGWVLVSPVPKQISVSWGPCTGFGQGSVPLLISGIIIALHPYTSRLSIWKLPKAVGTWEHEDERARLR